VGKSAVMNCEHDAVSFREVSDVSGTLRSPYSGRLIHELNWEKYNGAEKGMHRATIPFVGQEYGMKRIIQQCHFFGGRTNNELSTLSGAAGPMSLATQARLSLLRKDQRIIQFEGENPGIIRVTGFHEQILDRTVAINLFSYPT